MKWTWDPAAGAIYLYLIEGELDLRTVGLTGDDPPAEVMLDIDRGTGQIAGIEILTADGGSTFVKLAHLLAEKPEIACPTAHCPHLEKTEGCTGTMHG